MMQEEVVINEEESSQQDPILSEEFSAASYDENIDSEKDTDSSDEDSESNGEKEPNDEQGIDIDEEDEGLDELEKKEGKSKKKIPEWAQKNPAAWGERMAKKARKEAEREFNERVKALEEKLQKQVYSESRVDENEVDPIGDHLFYDPKNPEIVLDPNTPEGVAALQEFALESKRNEYHQKVELEKAKKKFEDNQKVLISKRHALKDKIEEFSKKDPKITDTIFESLSKCGEAAQEIFDFSSVVRSNQAEFLYYMSRNPKELTRISAMNPVDRYSELLRHHVEFNNRRELILNKPVTSEGGSVVKSGYSKADIDAKVRAKYGRQI